MLSVLLALGIVLVAHSWASGGSVEINTARHITVVGIDPDDAAGHGVAAGDYNDDGVTDLAVGARLADPPGRPDAGEIYVLFGPFDGTGTHCSGGFPCTIGLAGADVLLRGIDTPDFGPDAAGNALASGDLNGDGKDDLVAGASFASPDGKQTAGETYVVFGPLTAGTFDIGSERDIIIKGIDSGDHSGSGAAVEDMNDDGPKDLIVGAAEADPGGKSGAGETYVLFGPFDGTGTHCTGGFPCTIELTTADVTLNGIDAGDFSGADMEAADLNDDGKADLVVGANLANPIGRTDAGETYVVFGPLGAGTLDLGTAASVTINGIDIGDASGSGVGVGDHNNDGVTDLAIGAIEGDPGGRNSAGEISVLPGPFNGTGYYCAGGFPCTIDLTSAPFVVNGILPVDRLGRGATGGDLNGDGADDLVIGAQRGGASDAGEAYVLFGPCGSTADGDSDSLLDACDNCPSVPNGPAQAGNPAIGDQANSDADLAAEGASVAGDIKGNGCDEDDDNDSGSFTQDPGSSAASCPLGVLPLWADCIEDYLGTTIGDNCTGSPGPGGDAWPPDMNVDGDVNILDAFEMFPFWLGVSNRHDLNGDGDVNILDVFLMFPFWLSSCT